MTKANEDDLMPIGQLAAMVFNSKSDEMKDKLTASDLALYWGQPCLVFVDGEQCEADWKINTYLFETADLFAIVRPVLRPLSDMTEQEFEEYFDSDNSRKPFTENAGMYREAIRTAWLIRNGFDCFGWIDAGLAIDKTKIQDHD